MNLELLANTACCGRCSPFQDNQLRLAIHTYGPRDWKHISTRVSGRTAVQCLHRWHKVLRPGLRKGAWSSREDSIILDCRRAGIVRWAEIARHVSGRIGKQCRERWYNHLNPEIVKGEWGEDESSQLLDLYYKFGPRWVRIAKRMRGRTENSVKNHWNSAGMRKRFAARPHSQYGSVPRHDQGIYYILRRIQFRVRLLCEWPAGHIGRSIVNLQ